MVLVLRCILVLLYKKGKEKAKEEWRRGMFRGKEGLSKGVLTGC